MMVLRWVRITKDCADGGTTVSATTANSSLAWFFVWVMALPPRLTTVGSS